MEDKSNPIFDLDFAMRNLELYRSLCEGHQSGHGDNLAFDLSPLTENELTTTQLQICVGLSLGLTAKEIAKIRGSSYRTIETHIGSIKLKLQSKKLSPLLLARYAEHFLAAGFKDKV